MPEAAMPFPSENELDRLGAEIDKEMQQIAPRPAQVIPMPEYVNHKEETNEVGKLTSAAMASEYENAARVIEDMGRRLTEAIKENEREALEVVKGLEALRAQTEKAVGECQFAANAYRDRAKEIFDHIQNSSLLADEVKKACGDLVDKIRR